jgi:hypothetical protein
VETNAEIEKAEWYMLASKEVEWYYIKAVEWSMLASKDETNFLSVLCDIIAFSSSTLAVGLKPFTSGGTSTT